MTLDYILITYPDGHITKYRHMQVFVNDKATGVYLFRKIECSDQSLPFKSEECEYGALELAAHDITNLRMTYATLKKIGITYEEIEKD